MRMLWKTCEKNGILGKSVLKYAEDAHCARNVDVAGATALGAAGLQANPYLKIFGGAI